jgi:cell division protein FtsW
MKWLATALVFAVACLLALGLVMLYSASMAQTGVHYLALQLVACLLGLLGCAFTASTDARHLQAIAWGLWGLAMVLLALVLVPGIGTMINGARRWFDLGVLKFQPSEFAKFALIIGLAHYGARFRRQMGTFRFGVLLPALLVGPLLLLIFLGRDYGTTLLSATVAASMLVIAGVRWRHLLPPAAALGALFVFAVLTNPVRAGRVMAWLDPSAHREGVGYQVSQATIALGSGGWTGLGLGNGRQKMGFVPEQHTDFILSVVGEELGLVATLGVVALFVVVIGCGAMIARRADNAFDLLLASGVVLLVGLQAFINIGVVTGVLPNKGLPLPFISYGGSNLMMMLVGLGLLLGVARQSCERTSDALRVRGVENLSVEQMA